MPLERATLVRELYPNMVGRKETQYYVRGKWVSFHRDKINQQLKLGMYHCEAPNPGGPLTTRQSAETLVNVR